MKLLSLVFFVSLTSFAKEKHQEHAAHVHGGGKLAIAFDKSVGKIEFKSSAESILGFEHKAKTAKDKKNVAEKTTSFEKEISKMIQFDPTLNCQFKKEMIGQVPEGNDKDEKGSGEHSDWVANYTVTCVQAPIGTKITIDFTQFKALKDLDVTILIDALQKSAEFKGQPIVIDLNSK